MHTCTVVVPMYQPLANAAERLSLEQTLEVLADYSVYLVGPQKLQPYFEQLAREYGHDTQNKTPRLHYKTFADQYFRKHRGV
jgi:hypothetical protein